MTVALEEIDNLAGRIENLPALLDDAEKKYTGIAEILMAAGDKYQEAVTAFTESAKQNLSDHLDREAKTTVAQQSETMREIVRKTLQSEVASFQESVQDAVSDLKRSRTNRLMENGMIAVIASLLTSLIMYVLL